MTPLSLHVVSGRLFGGIEQMLVTLARWRHITPESDVAFAVAAPGRLDDELRASGAVVHALGNVRLIWPASVVRARSTLQRVLAREREERPVVVVCHAPWSFALFAPVARRQSIPCVLWQHDHASGESLVELWARRTRADLVICNSLWTSKTAAVLQPGVDVAIHHPPVALPDVPANSRHELRAALETGSSDVVLLCASRLERWKGHLNLVQALAHVEPRDRWTLWVAGGAQRPHEARYLSQLKQDIDRSGIGSRVRFLGERRDVPSLIKAADLVCQPNEGPEPFGVVFAEALLSGVPVVAANLGGAPEIVSSSCGRLVPAHDVDALADTLRTLIADRELRAALGSQGPPHARARVAPEVVLPRLARTLGGLIAA